MKDQPTFTSTGSQCVTIITLCTYMFPTQTQSLGNQGKHTELIYTNCEARIIFMLSSPQLFHSFRQKLSNQNHMSFGHERFLFSLQSCFYKLSVFQYLPSTKWSLCWAAIVLPEGMNMGLLQVEHSDQQSYQCSYYFILTFKQRGVLTWLLRRCTIGLQVGYVIDYWNIHKLNRN